MKTRTIFEWLMGISAKDHEIFYEMPLKVKIKVVMSIFCTTLSMIVLMHLGLFGETGALRNLTKSYSQLRISALYTCIMLAFFIPEFLNIMFPLLKKWVARSANFFFSGLAIILIFYNKPSKIDTPADFKLKLVILIVGFLGIAFAMKLYANASKHLFIEKTRIETKIKLAREIQEELVPPLSLKEEHFELYGETYTPNEVGGDHFDVVSLDKDRLAVAVGDVSGHNVGAGLLMAVTKTAFLTEVWHHPKPEELLPNLNRTVIRYSTKRMFVTFVLGIVDFKEHVFTFADAGHPPVLHFKPASGEIVELKAKGPALGISKSSTYRSDSVPFEKGDIFIFFTDGLMEAQNPGDEEFGMENVRNLLKKIDTTWSSRELYLFIMEELQRFTCGVPLEDDTTVAVLKIT
ncbi:MAG: serine/threonine-protein phosphatase [bacterium]|nr:serine/threonine-protein phosphatase [bacterium]